MLKSENRRITPSLVISMIALFVAIGGSAVALKGKNTVDAGDLKKNSVASSEVKSNAIKNAEMADNSVGSAEISDNAVGSGEIADDAVGSGEIVNNAVTGADIDESSLSPSIPPDEVQKYPSASFRVAATLGATEAAARAAAPEIPLTSNGPFSLYGKCFFDDTNDDVLGEIYIRTSQNGAIFESRAGDSKDGGPAATDFLNTDTLETDREIENTEESTLNQATLEYDDEEPFMAAAPDGTQIHGLFEVAVKNGELPGGNGIYGAGNACIFTGYTFG